MAEYKKFARPGGFRRPGPAGNSSSFKKELYDAECANCHKRCQVPFRPNGKKPVHCADCYTKDDTKRGPSKYGADDRKYAPRSTYSAPVADTQIQDLTKQVAILSETVAKLAASVESFSRATAFTAEVRKHLPVEEAPAAPAKKKAAAKKTVKKK